jgi:hypothetical protein
MNTDYLHMQPFLSADDADTMMRLAETFDSFGTYANEATSEGLGEKLPQRFDAGMNYASSGIDGAGNNDDPATAASRTNYFRETYAYGSDIKAPGIEAFMNNDVMVKTAQQISGCDLIVPAIVYANLLIPGQELAIHTDVPEFRGANRKVLPQWLLVCMLHSGLFDDWRIPILTCVSWFGNADGGGFTFYPDGAKGQRQSIPASHNSAILIDTDKVFHGIERVNQTLPNLPTIGKRTRLNFCGDGAWELRDESTVLANYSWPQLRYSISWKAYCFKDQAQETLWRDGAEDLTLDHILEVFERELQKRGLIEGSRPEPDDFALLMVSNFIHFPKAA